MALDPGEDRDRRTAAGRLREELRATIPDPVPHTGDRRDTDWQADAACLGLDPELFFPETTPSEVARATCLGCPVRAECLGFALSFPSTQVVGVWGGTSQSQRARLGRVTRAAAS